MAHRKTTGEGAAKSKRRRQKVKKTPSLLIGATRLRSDPLREFDWATGGMANAPGTEGNSQPPVGLWYSPAPHLRVR